MALHEYGTMVAWTGNRGEGTNHYRGYDRSWRMQSPGKIPIDCSNDPLLGGDPTKPNPEDLLLASLSACHMLWFLHLASSEGIVVLRYEDSPIAIGETLEDGAGRFVSAILKPNICLAYAKDQEQADKLHDKVHEYCFIARSISFPVRCEAFYSW